MKTIAFWAIPHSCQTVDLDSQKKEKNNISQMWLGSVFKMRTGILNIATTEQMGYIIFLFSSTLNLQIRFFCEVSGLFVVLLTEMKVYNIL